jgi:hypothetical protein
LTRTGFTRSAIVLSGLALAMTATGCGGPTKDWTFQGSRIADVDESLKTLTGSFRDAVAAQETPATVPDEAKCYVQVVSESSVKDEVVCGPLRYLGDEEDSWVGTTVVGAPAKKDRVQLVAEDADNFHTTEPDKQAETLDAKAKTPPEDLDIAAPAAPKAAVGDTLPAVEDSSLGDDGLTVETPDATYLFTTLGVSDHVGDGADRVDAPEGGSIVSVEMTRDAKGDAPNGSTSAANLVVGGKKVDMPEDGGAVAVDGDGADAEVDIEYDGNTQKVSLAKKKLVAGHPYTSETLEPVNTPKDELIGDENKGASTSYQFGAEAAISSWDEKDSWAPEGKDRLALQIGFDESSKYTEKHDSLSYDVDYDHDVTYSVKDLKVTADDEDVKVDPSSLKVKPRADDDWAGKENQFTVDAEVPTGTEEIKVSGTVTRSGEYEKSDVNEYPLEHLKNEPKSISNDLELKEVTLQPKESAW